VKSGSDKAGALIGVLLAGAAVLGGGALLMRGPPMFNAPLSEAPSLETPDKAPVFIAALREIPAVDVAQEAARGVMADLAAASESVFDDPAARQEAKTARRAAALAALGGWPSERRAAFWALWLRDNLGADGLHTFFFLEGGRFAPQVLDGLRALDLKQEAEIFAEAMATFGPDYPVDGAVRAERFAWSKPGRAISEHITEPNPPNAFDKALMAIAARFGDEPAFARTLDAAFRRDPELSAWIAREREKLADERRLAWLLRHLDLTPGLPIQEALARRPEPYRLLYVLEDAHLEAMNGGVHQYFYNSSGDLALEFIAAARKTGAQETALAIEKAAASFAGGYSSNREARHAAMERLAQDSPKIAENWSRWDEALNEGTGAFDRGEIQEAQLRLAREAGILPK
jgi:hypothetical protein